MAASRNDFARVLTGMRDYLAGGELVLPALPAVAVRVVDSGSGGRANAHDLATIIDTDATLSSYVQRIAASAAKRPAQRIVSLQHALAWLGVDETANIAFTLALQHRMLDVKGQQRKARRLWRHSLASALWARQLARLSASDTGMCYLSALLHDIGKLITLGAVHDIAQRQQAALSAADYDLLLETFHRSIGLETVRSWSLPEPVPSVIANWRDYPPAGEVRCFGMVVNLAHLLADRTLHESTMLERDALIGCQAYQDLGFTRADASGLFESATSIEDELDLYLAP